MGHDVLCAVGILTVILSCSGRLWLTAVAGIVVIAYALLDLRARLNARRVPRIVRSHQGRNHQ